MGLMFCIMTFLTKKGSLFKVHISDGPRVPEKWVEHKSNKVFLYFPPNSPKLMIFQSSNAFYVPPTLKKNLGEMKKNHVHPFLHRA